MKNTLINNIILSSTVICAAQTPPTPSEVKPAFYGISKFNETNSPIWNLDDNLNSFSNPFELNFSDFVTETGPSIISDWTLGPQEFVRATINPKEHVQNGTNIFHNLIFYYKWYNIGWTDVSLRVNGVFFCSLPAVSSWTKFSTNVNFPIVNSLSWEVNNPTSRAYFPTFQVDAVQWHPIYTFPTNNSTNFMVATTGLKSNVKWNANVYPAGSQGFRLYSSKNMVNFSLITNTPVLTNGFFTVSLNKGNNEFYQLRTP
jgi:hypothetical protein